MEKDKVFKGDNGFYGIGGETWITYEPDFDTEAEAQAILDAHNSGAESYQEAAQMALEKALSENDRLESTLADTAAQLTDAVQRAQEAEYNLHLMTKQADAFHAENSQLRQQLEHQSAAYYLLRDECDEKMAELEAELREARQVQS